MGRWEPSWRRWALRRIGLPLFNRFLRESGVHLYRYVPESDRLMPVRSLGMGDLESSGEILSDRWYRVLAERRVQVPLAFDVGVNYGYTSAWLSRMAERVVAFEPTPKNRDAIREQLRIRGINNVEVWPAAISKSDGKMPLYLKRFDGHHSLADIGASPTVDQIEVDVTTLDQVCRRLDVQEVGILKVDVEGFEREVFLGAEDLLSRQAIGLVVFEFSPGFYRQRQLDPRGPLDLLRRHGYCVRTLDGEEPPDPTSSDVWQIDLVAEPDRSLPTSGPSR
jgi:FkbM family methyltransferase